MGKHEEIISPASLKRIKSPSDVSINDAANYVSDDALATSL